MIQRILSYYHNTVHPWDYWITHLKRKNTHELKIGFCSVLPPFQNGSAAGAYYILQELAKHTDIEIFLIPLKKKIDKKLFSFMPLAFTTLDDPTLDVIIFWCVGKEIEKYLRLVRCKTIAWQTMHEDPLKKQSEQETFDAIKKTDLVLATSQWAYACYKKQVSHVAYLPCGVDPTTFVPSSKKEFTCLFVSRIHYYKGIMPFLDSIPLVLEKNKEVYFHIVSPIDTYSPYLNEIKQKIHDLTQKYGDHMKIHTQWIPYSEIPTYYASADIFVFPSNNEGFGIPLIEAMSSEIPCLVLDKKPMNEIVINEKTGFCLKPLRDKTRYHGFTFPDPQEIAEKILYLKSHKKIRESISKNGRERVIQEYDLKKVIIALLKHCSELQRSENESSDN